MSRYIDADELITSIQKEIICPHYNVVHKVRAINRIIKKLSTTDVKPVVRGEWMVDSPYSCSVCDGVNEHKDHFCPHCGADMRGK